MRADQDYALTLWLAQRPGFCGCCWCLGREDARRARRVFRFVRAIMKDWDEERRMQEQARRET